MTEPTPAAPERPSRADRRRDAAVVIGVLVVGVAVVAAVFSLAAGALPSGPHARSSKPPSASTTLATLKVRHTAVTVEAAGRPAFAAAKDGQALHQGDTVATDAQGEAEIDYTDGSLTRLAPSTQFTLTALTNERGGRQTLGTLTAGQTWNRAAKVSETGSFGVTAGQTTAAVEGTAFVFSCALQGSIRVCTIIAVVDNVRVTTPGGAVALLTPATEVIVTNDVAGVPTQLTYEQLVDLPFVVDNLILDQQAGIGNGLGDLPPPASPPTSPPPTGSSSSSTGNGAPTMTVVEPTSTTEPATTTTLTTTTLPPPDPRVVPCLHDGWTTRVGISGTTVTTFANEAQCVAFRLADGQFATAADGFIVPRGSTVSLTGMAFNACNSLSTGYELNLDGTVANVVSGEPACGLLPEPDAHVGPFPTAVLLRIVLTDDTCAPKLPDGESVFDSNGSHALVTAVDDHTWSVDIMDAGGNCEFPTGTARPPLAPGQGNVTLTLAIGS
jgi:hypothetical protein